jgi:subtilisin family serine protease
MNESLPRCLLKFGEDLHMIWTFLVNRILLVFAIVFSSLLGWPRQQALAFEDPVPLSSQMLLIKFDPSLSAAERQRIIDGMDAELVYWLPQIDTAQVRPLSTTSRTASALSLRYSHPSVLTVESDFEVMGVFEDQMFSVEALRRPASARLTPLSAPLSAPVTVNDPYFSDAAFVYAPHRIGIEDAWRFSMGDPSIIVAIVDTGVNASHPELAGQILKGYDFVNDDADADDDQGHGTHVAGIVAAAVDNGLGIAGICPYCTILPIKVLSALNSGSAMDVAAGIIYATDHGAAVINLSLGSELYSQVIADAVDYAQKQGVLIVAAVGNGRSQVPFYPAALDSVIAVTATNLTDERWSFSNYGSWVDLAAPGVNIFSTAHVETGAHPGYTVKTGTSMAAPHVSGVVALLRSLNPLLSVDEVRHILLSTADDLGDPGPDHLYGQGRINASTALSTLSRNLVENGGVAGVAWDDGNGNGLMDDDESLFTGSLTISIQNSEGQMMITQSGEEGKWGMDDLYPGQYYAIATATDNCQVTSAKVRLFSIEKGKVVTDVNFGVLLNSQEELFYTFLPLTTTGRHP